MTQVSIITPFLNAEAFLQEAIDSVRAQTAPEWELLLVDDGSNDGSSKIAQAAVRKDPRIRLLSVPKDVHHGAAAARNMGIAAASGDFVAFLDADDVFEPHMLATTLQAAADHPNAGMIFGPTLWWYSDGSGRDWLETTDGREERLHRPPSLLQSMILLQRGHVPCICSVLIRKTALSAVGGFDEGFRLYEDQTLWVKIFNEYDVYITPKCLSRYRQHDGSVSSKASNAGEYDRLSEHPAREAFLVWIEEYLQSFPPNSRLKHSLRLARAVYRKNGRLIDQLDRLAFRFLLQTWQLPRRVKRKIGRIIGLKSKQFNHRT